MRVASAAVLASALLLSACTGGDPDPSGTPPASVTASTTPPTTATTSAPTTSPPVKTTPPVDPVLAKIPADARKETPAGAEAFVKFYFDQLNRGSKESTPAPVEGLAAKSCETCAAFETSLRDLQTRGNRYSDSSVLVKYASASKFVDDSKLVLVSIEQSSVPILNKRNEIVSSTKAGNIVFTATLTFDSRWSIAALRATK